jgi:hypothetical protein
MPNSHRRRLSCSPGSDGGPDERLLGPSCLLDAAVRAADFILTDGFGGHATELQPNLDSTPARAS